MATPNLSSRIDKLVELLGAHDRALPTTAELALAVYATAMEGDIFEQFIGAAPWHLPANA